MPSLKNENGLPTYWRSLDQLADSDEFRTWLDREFPEGASELNNPVTRRSFLTVMGASVALAGLTGCRKPVEHIVPYVSQPEDAVIGKPEYYATAMPRGTSSLGLLVKSNEGRPTKVEGNDLHPSSQGSADLWALGSLLNLYDPDRSKRNLQNNGLRSWDQFADYWRERLAQYTANGGEGLVLLSEPFASPTLHRLRQEFLKKYPKASWIAYEPVSEENRDRGLTAAAGAPLQPVYSLDKADVILSLDHDFVQTEQDAVKHAKAFANGRRISRPQDRMNRLYVVESQNSSTGSMADHRLRLQSRQIGAFAAALVLELERRGLAVDGSDALARYASHTFDRTWIEAVADDLLANKGRSLVLVGRRQPAALHALAFAINKALGDFGKTVSYLNTTEVLRSDRDGLAKLTARMRGGKVSTLVMLGGNPVYDAPSDLDFAGAMKGVEASIHLSEYEDETSQRSSWHLTRAHFLEAWGDVRGTDGSLSVIQPLISPLFGSHSDVELVTLLTGGTDIRGYETVRATWMNGLLSGDKERAWRHLLHDGILVNSSQKGGVPRVMARDLSALLRKEPFPTDMASSDNLEVVFTVSNTLHDGRYTNNAWLMETPDPTTKITWDNAALMSKKTADELGVGLFEGVSIEVNGARVELPVYIVPGHADHSITLEYGYGRSNLGRVANGHGVNIYPLRSSRDPEMVLGARAAATGVKHVVADTQDHNVMEGREIIREATLDTYREYPNFAREMVEQPDLQSLWKDWTWQEGYQWGMAIDLNVCTGCNACVVACQSENNVPVVGKEQVNHGREMHWMRLDRYFVGSIEEGRMVNQPMLCQQCEMAPCEQVCPVNATVHDQEGLNMMTYNRCIGTRYCSNNCPYKVRRFNFFNYTNELPELIKMAQNPEVTVRSRGVMEKCSYCLHRINHGKFAAKEEGREVRDGEIRTACQQACPTDAIVFGNINDPKSQVTRQKRNSRNYGVLSEFNTRPRTTYLARLHNPNPKLGAPVFDTEFVPREGEHEMHGA